MRTIDPDQDWAYYGNYNTRNYVHYRHDAAGYTHTKNPDTNLVCALSNYNIDFFVGLGTVDYRAVVSHYGFRVNNPADAFLGN